MKKAGFAVMTVLLLAACQDVKQASEANFSAAVQSYLDSRQGMCVGIPGRQYPYQAEHDSALVVQDRARLAALATAGLLRDVGTPDAPRYELTSAAQPFLVRGDARHQGLRDAFCTGHLVLDGITSFSEPSDTGGLNISRVNYTYHVRDAAPWLRDPAVQQTYPELEPFLAQAVPGQALLVLTSQGWVHQNLFR
ncbi:hypothetical protein [Alcaligenes sp. SDU_A2]|uniref:hypothetical protein n=1 Tax=Alcaligenes sp. SDU_A2 TaxID=3136634 RepID=UPI00311F7E40